MAVGAWRREARGRTAAERRRQALLFHLPVLFGYLFLSLLLTWPLAAHVATRVTGDGIDDPALAWNLWWVKERLVDAHSLDLFHSGSMFHPLGINLGFYTLTPLNGLLSVPLQTAWSLIAANNLLLLSSFVLGAYGTFLLARDLLAQTPLPPREGAADHPSAALWAAFLAGLIYGFASSRFFYASLGQFNIASSQWIPFCALYVLRSARPGAGRMGLRSAALAGLFLVLQAWAELTFASFLLIFVAVFALWQLVASLAERRPSAPVERRLGAEPAALLARFVLLAAVSLLGILPFLWAMAPDLRREGDFFAAGGGFADLFSADLAGYLLPTRLHPLVGDWVAGLPFPNDKGQHIFAGYSVLALAALGAWAMLRRGGRSLRRMGGFWLTMLVLSWLLTLGPRWRWMGHELPIPGPFELVSRLPFFSGNRYPSRYSVLLMLCAAVLSAYGAAWLLARWPEARRRQGRIPLLAVFLALLFTFEQLSLPLPLTDFRVPPLYVRLAAETEGVLLELPTGWRNGARVLGRSDVLIMMQQWYQTTHGLPRLGGNTSRNPPHKFQYFSEAPLLGDLIALMNADREHIAPVVDRELPAMIARDRPLAAAVLDFLGVERVLVYVDHAPPALLRFIDEALPLTLTDEWQGLDWLGRSSTLRLYAVTPSPPAAGWEIDLAGEMGRLHLAEGWSSLAAADPALRFATRSEADLLLDLPAAGGVLALELAGPASSVEMALNGLPLGTAPLGAEPSEVRVTVPPGTADAAVDRLSLRFRGTPQPAAAAISPPAGGWPVGQTGGVLDPAAAVVVRSAGEEVGDFAHIWVNGSQVAPNRRGYNLAALTPAGELLDSAVFDTHGDPAASAALAAWLEGWPEGVLVAGAVADEASLSLGEEAVDALRRIGVSEDLRGRFRWSHAFVGRVGAPAGSALEEARLLQPASAAVSAPVDAAAVYGAIGRVRFSAVP